MRALLVPTIRDVAELACVSVATVSRVINRSPIQDRKPVAGTTRDGSLKLSIQCKRTSSGSTK